MKVTLDRLYKLIAKLEGLKVTDRVTCGEMVFTKTGCFSNDEHAYKMIPSEEQVADTWKYIIKEIVEPRIMDEMVEDKLHRWGINKEEKPVEFDMPEFEEHSKPCPLFGDITKAVNESDPNPEMEEPLTEDEQRRIDNINKNMQNGKWSESTSTKQAREDFIHSNTKRFTGGE